MVRSTALQTTLVAAAAIALIAAGGVAADGPVVAEDGGTYQKPVVLQFDVANENGTYELRTASDRAFVAELIAENGAVTLETASLRPGDYVLLDSETDRVEYRFTLTANPDAGNDTDAGDRSHPNLTVSAGETYPLDARLLVSVEGGHRYEVVPLFDWSYAMYKVGDGGTIAVEAWRLRPGWYAVYESESDRAVTTFRLTAAPNESREKRDATHPPSALVPNASDRRNATTVGSRQVLWRGQSLAFRVDGDVRYVLRADNGTALGWFEPRDHEVVLSTAQLSTGTYTLERPDGHVAYRFALASQSLSVSAEESALRITSNRRGYDLVVTSPNLSRDVLAAVFPTAVERSGAVVLPDIGSESRVPVNVSALPAGNHTVTLRAADAADAAETVTVTVPIAESGTTVGGDTPNGAPPRGSATEPVTATASPTLATSATPTASATAHGSTAPATSGRGPGFGVVAAVCGLAVGLVQLSRC